MAVPPSSPDNAPPDDDNDPAVAGGGGGGSSNSSSGGKYQPDPDDRAELASESPESLTLTQQLLLKQYAEQVHRMSDEDARTLALEVARQMMAKDNIMRTLTGRDMPPEYNIQPPDPELPINDDDDSDDGNNDDGNTQKRT